MRELLLMHDSFGKSRIVVFDTSKINDVVAYTRHGLKQSLRIGFAGRRFLLTEN
jgi:hypothetical protein